MSGFLTKLGNTNAGKFNTTGRAFPDVAFNGVDFNIFSGGEEGTVDGTSCSAPSFAAVVSLINSQLIAAGKPVLGFLNPFIYSTASSAFTDITTGDNPGCGTNGFPAVAGWDPVRHTFFHTFELTFNALHLDHGLRNAQLLQTSRCCRRLIQSLICVRVIQWAGNKSRNDIAFVCRIDTQHKTHLFGLECMRSNYFETWRYKIDVLTSPRRIRAILLSSWE